MTDSPGTPTSKPAPLCLLTSWLETSDEALQEFLTDKQVLEDLATKELDGIPGALFQKWLDKFDPRGGDNDNTPMMSAELKQKFVRRAMADTLVAVENARLDLVEDEGARQILRRLKKELCEDTPYTLTITRKISLLETAQLHARNLVELGDEC